MSLIGKGYHNEEQPMGFHTVADSITSRGGIGAFQGAILCPLVAPAVFVAPGIGQVAPAGPVVAFLVGALEGPVVVGVVSVRGAALSEGRSLCSTGARHGR